MVTFLLYINSPRILCLYDEGLCVCAFAAIYLCSLLGHFHQGIELVSDPGQCSLLKQTLLSLSKHHPNQHTEHGWTHIVTGSVGECLLQVVQEAWGRTKDQHSSEPNYSKETIILVNYLGTSVPKQQQGKTRLLFLCT